MNKSALGIHQVELVIESCPGFGDRSCIAQHANRSANFCKIPRGHCHRWLVIDTHFETGGTPVDELNRALKAGLLGNGGEDTANLGFNMCDGGIDVLGDQVAAVEKATSHVLAGSRVALDQLIRRVEARACYFHHCMLLVSGFCAADDRCIGREREMDSELKIENLKSRKTLYKKTKTIIEKEVLDNGYYIKEGMNENKK